jgi:hypothetical protein
MSSQVNFCKVIDMVYNLIPYNHASVPVINGIPSPSRLAKQSPIHHASYPNCQSTWLAWINLSIQGRTRDSVRLWTAPSMLPAFSGYPSPSSHLFFPFLDTVPVTWPSYVAWIFITRVTPSSPRHCLRCFALLSSIFSPIIVSSFGFSRRAMRLPTSTTSCL